MEPTNTPIPEKPEVPTPTNPVINPGGSASIDASVDTGTEVSALGATEPIMMPTPPKAPDPEEEELKAPLKPAEPVPGSIGSAISVPSASGKVGVAQKMQAPSIAPTATNKSGKKQVSKTTWVLLIIVAVLVIAVLAIVLYKLLNPDS